MKLGKMITAFAGRLAASKKKTGCEYSQPVEQS